MYTVFGDIKSGNCYKVKLIMNILGIQHEWKHINILNGETRTEGFLKINPNGKIPTLLFEDGRVLSESNAIINYLAEDTPYYPRDAWLRAQILQWQFFEQYSHEPYIAVARYINKYLGMPDDRKEEYQAKQAGGHKALKIMDDHFKNNGFLVNDGLTTADISLYAYTHVAAEGGFDLLLYPNLNAWLERVEAQAGFAPMA